MSTTVVTTDDIVAVQIEDWLNDDFFVPELPIGIDTTAKPTAAAWLDEVSAVDSYLNETYTVSFAARGGFAQRLDTRVPWAKSGIRKFTDRVIPMAGSIATTTGSIGIQALREALQNAVTYGNGSIILEATGHAYVADPRTSYAVRTPMGYSEFRQSLGAGVKLWAMWDEALWITYPSGMQVPARASVFTFFYNPVSGFSVGSSRLGPAIRSLIKAAAANLRRMEYAAEFYSFRKRYLKNVSDELSDDVREAARALESGMSSWMELPLQDGDKQIDIGELDASTMEPFVKIHETYAKTTAAAWNIDPSEYGVILANPSSADALYASKEDLVLEVKAFERSVTPTAQKFITAFAQANGETPVQLQWEEPSTPSAAQQADITSKRVAAYPELTQVPSGMAMDGLSQTTIDEILELRAKKGGTDNAAG